MDNTLRRLRQSAARTYLSQRDRLLDTGASFWYRNNPATRRATVWVRLPDGQERGYELSDSIPHAPHRAMALVADARGRVGLIISGGHSAEEAAWNLAELIADRVEQEVGHQGMARMVVQLQRPSAQAALDPGRDEPQARHVGEGLAGARRSISELAELSAAEAVIDQLEALLAARAARLREAYTRIGGGAPAEFHRQLQAELGAAAPEWRALLEGEAPPDTGITELEREALRGRFAVVSARIDQCEAIGRALDAALGRLIELRQSQGDGPADA